MSVIFEQVSTLFYGRTGPVALQYDGYAWVIGGREQPSGAYKDEVWRSLDGLVWENVAMSTAMPNKAFGAGLVFDNKMWIFGGSNGSANDPIIWSSTDGVTWTNSGTLPTTYPLHAMNVIVFDDKMWILGGMGAPSDPVANRNNQIFSSTDGSSWSSHGTGAYGAREYSGVFVVGAYIYLIAGAQSSYMSDVWRSTDCINWSQISTGQFTTRYGQRGAYYNNKMWVVCGTNAGFINDVFSSSDGITWAELGIKITYIYYHATFVIGDSIFLVGGVNNGISKINMNYSVPAPVEKCGGYLF